MFFSLFKRKTEQEKIADKLLRKNNCVCYCKSCKNVLSDKSELTAYEGVYKETCSNCKYVGYFDYCHPAPLHFSIEDFNKYSEGMFGSPFINKTDIFND